MKIKLKKRIGLNLSKPSITWMVLKITKEPPDTRKYMQWHSFFKLDVSFVSYALNEQTLHEKEKGTKTHINF
jgi:hypothetical protein